MMLHVKMNCTSFKILVLLGTLTAVCTGQGLGQTCDCSKPGDCNPPRLCYPGSQQCNRENVALGRPTNMSSSGNTPPCLVVDGNITLSSNGDCTPAESRIGDFSAWWYVDLGQNYTITNITIYKVGTWWSRMADFQVKVDGQLCYTFPSHNELNKLKSLPFPVNIQCDPPLTGRVVSLQKVNTDRTDSYVTHVIYVCEVQVWGCAPGYYGADCAPCGHCAGDGTCNIVTGVCPSGCLAGWQGPQCLRPCGDGTYGPDCANQCGQCAGGSTCNKIHGDCPAGCQEGWNGTRCDRNIDTSTRGENYSSLVAPRTAVGPIVGAIIGGVVIGAILAVPVTICVIRYRSRRSAPTKQTPPQAARLSTHSKTQNHAAPTPNPLAQRYLASTYEDVGERRNTYDSLQPEDKRPDEKSVYTNPVFKADGGQADTVYYGNTDHEDRLKLEGTRLDQNYYNT